ncbi:MAG: LytTR family transcriptional regulator [Blastomonas fulva]|uniref:LytTR family DNA-binding domain-containing protein n=1 Tax=Blastomonas fulva TaxID=1550728 RepID=UPI0024E23C02|nr:LytTR family DNA-binding domain-containing protein [Blastomonas fulva]MDK2755781.1 LytTR family transcriptional regulator [Blastomonas fulva]
MRENEASAVRASPNAFSLQAQAFRGLGIAAAAAAVLAYLGALGTGEAPLGLRLAYWAAVIMPGSFLGMGGSALVRSWGGLESRRWLEIALVALLVSLPHSFIVIVVSALFFGVEMITPMLVLQFWLAVLLITLVLTAINYLANADIQPRAPALQPAMALPDAAQPVPSQSAQPESPQPEGAPAIPPLLAEKLPVNLRSARLLAIEAEDHYLRVRTDAGSNLVLMRMTDACALLDDAPGARVHRSWWVARAAVTSGGQRAGRMMLDLSSGLQVPVSRAMQQRLKGSGWFSQGS